MTATILKLVRYKRRQSANILFYFFQWSTRTSVLNAPICFGWYIVRSWWHNDPTVTGWDFTIDVESTFFDHLDQRAASKTDNNDGLWQQSLCQWFWRSKCHTIITRRLGSRTIFWSSAFSTISKWTKVRRTTTSPSTGESTFCVHKGARTPNPSVAMFKDEHRLSSWSIYIKLTKNMN